jgi:hypothetical protein
MELVCMKRWLKWNQEQPGLVEDQCLQPLKLAWMGRFRCLEEQESLSCSMDQLGMPHSTLGGRCIPWFELGYRLRVVMMLVEQVHLMVRLFGLPR